MSLKFVVLILKHAVLVRMAQISGESVYGLGFLQSEINNLTKPIHYKWRYDISKRINIRNNKMSNK